MKIKLLKKSASVILAITVLMVTSCSNNKSTNENKEEQVADSSSQPQFEDSSVNDVYHHYIHLKTALVNSDDAEAKKGAEELETAILTTEAKELATVVSEIKSAGDIEARRALFNKLSESLSDYFKAKKLTAGVIYKQHCPMANNNEGGSWLSSEKEIKNPYYGDKMLKCGTVEEEIK